MDLSRYRYQPASPDDEKPPKRAKILSRTECSDWDGPLPPILRPGLKCVFVGFNPGVESGRRGHYYAHHSNRFWKFLYKSGFVNRVVTFDDDQRMPEEYGYGFTDLVSRCTKGISELSIQEMADGVDLLEERLREVSPYSICLIGKGIWEAIAKARGWPRKGFNYGAQPQTFGVSILCVLPSTSGLNSMGVGKQLALWEEVRKLVQLSGDAAESTDL